MWHAFQLFATCRHTHLFMTYTHSYKHTSLIRTAVLVGILSTYALCNIKIATTYVTPSATCCSACSASQSHNSKCHRTKHLHSHKHIHCRAQVQSHTHKYMYLYIPHLSAGTFSLISWQHISMFVCKRCWCRAGRANALLPTECDWQH